MSVTNGESFETRLNHAVAHLISNNAPIGPCWSPIQRGNTSTVSCSAVMCVPSMVLYLQFHEAEVTIPTPATASRVTPLRSAVDVLQVVSSTRSMKDHSDRDYTHQHISLKCESLFRFLVCHLLTSDRTAADETAPTIITTPQPS